MKELLMHPMTAAQLQQFISSPSHAVMLIGASGSGKSSLAIRLAENVLGLKGNLNDYPYKLIITDEDGKAIGIESVRQLEHFLSLKVPRRTAYNRVVIIENAHKLTGEAQNSLLKTLEEPPEATLIILNTNHEQALLPTVRSRAQSLIVKKPLIADINSYFKAQKHPAAAIKQAYAISGGLPGLMQALLAEQDHPLLQATSQARELLQGTTYERLLMADDLSKHKDLALNTLFILQQMAHVSLQSAAGASAKKWQTILTASYQATEALLQNAQPKLALTNLCLSL